MKKLLSFLLSLTLVIASLCFSPLSAAADDGAPAMTVPQVRIVTQDGNGLTLQKADGYVNAAVTITDVDGSTLSDSVQFKVRGNSTALASITKKAFTFKFEKKKDVLGMGKGKKWALLANAFDPTLMRNYIAFDLAHKMNLAFTSEQRYVELWLDGSYRGCYTLMEPVQEGKERVNIDIEGNNGLKDFMIEREATRSESDVTYFKTDGIRFAISEPDAPTADQLAYIQSTMNDIMTVIKSGDRSAVEAAIDVPSFTRFYLLNELYKTVDFDFSSVYFYYKDGKLYAGPAWDYDLAAGNVNAGYSQVAANSAATEGLFAADRHLYKYLCSYEWFRDEIRATYREYYDDIVDITAEGGVIDTLLTSYGELYSRNFTEAGWSPSKWWVNVQMRPLSTYDANLTYLRTWLTDRNAWLSDYYALWEGWYLLGDADGDGTVSILDATKIQRLLADLVDDTDGMIALRGTITNEPLNILDATLIQRFIAGFHSPYPIGEHRRAAD